MPKPWYRTYSKNFAQTTTTQSLESNLFELFILVLRGDPEIKRKANGSCEIITNMIFFDKPLTLVIPNTTPEKIRALTVKRSSPQLNTERAAILDQLKQHFATLLNLSVADIEKDKRVNQLFYHISNLGTPAKLPIVLNEMKKREANPYTANDLQLTKPNYEIKLKNNELMCVESYSSTTLKTSFRTTTVIATAESKIAALEIFGSDEHKALLNNIEITSEEEKHAQQPDAAIRKFAPTGRQILWDKLTSSNQDYVDARSLATIIVKSVHPAGDLLKHLVEESKSLWGRFCRWVTGKKDPLQILLADKDAVVILNDGLKDNKEAQNLLKACGIVIESNSQSASGQAEENHHNCLQPGVVSAPIDINAKTLVRSPVFNTQNFGAHAKLDDFNTGPSLSINPAG